MGRISIKEVVLLLQPFIFLALAVVSADDSLPSSTASIAARSSNVDQDVVSLPNNYNPLPSNARIKSIIDTTRSLEEVDGTTACKNCKGDSQCVGRTISDENCNNCANGQTFWPCNLKKECWCWDTTLSYRDPGDGDSTGACAGCGAGGRDGSPPNPNEICVGNMNSLIPVGDEECSACSAGQSFWPCDDVDLCWCWDQTKPKQPPAPTSGLEIESDAESPCDSYFGEDLFDLMAPNATFPYTYEGFCNAIDDYNAHHKEKIFMMGSLDLRKSELAAFLGNTAHESDDFEAGREYLACGDRKEIDGKVYCKPCTNDLYDWIENTCSVSMVDQNAPYNSYCQPSFEPPEGCVCDTLTQVEESGELAGYVEASKVFYGRGAIQLSWNYNYIRASYALTGNAETFCQNPEMVATNELYAWGSGIYFWMENQKEGTTCHKEALKNDFGGTLNNINGGLECPAYHGGWHSSAIKMRINRYCHAASLLKLTELSSLSGCKGMQDSYEECMADGTCKYCEEFPPPRNNTATNISKEGESVETDTSSANDASEEEEVQNSETPTKMPTSTKESSSASSPPTISEQQSSASSPPTSPGKPTPTTSSTNVSLNETPPSTSSPTISLEQPSPATSSPTVLSSNNSTTQQPSLLLSTNPPTISPTTSETENPTPPTILEPSYAPTTPQPTMGPCDGEPCPGKLCRSLWGFCGGGDGYCNDNAVWSPSCKDNSEPPTLPPAGTSASASTDSLSLAPSALSTFRLHASDSDSTTELPTKSPIGYGYGFDTDYGYGYDAASEKLTSSPTYAASEKLTSSPTDTVVKTFVKPQPGKKPPPGRTKPTSTSENSSESSGKTSTTEEQEKSPPPTTSPVREGTNQPTNPPNNMPPTLHPTMKEYSPTDPESTYYCGKSWANANEDCRIRCPSAKSEDCPEGMSCYAFTTCNDTKQPTSSPISSAIDEIPENAEEIDSMIIAAPETANLPDTTVPASTNESTANSDGCTGSPCPVAGECRSEYGFCGATFIYCNTLSSWTFETCGLFGTNDDGDTILCDADVFECPDGKHVQQDPSNGCEYFACPAEKKTQISSILSTPVSSPTLPELPKPTLPIISNPEKQTLDSKPAVGSQHNIVLPSLGSKPAKGSQPIVIGGEKDKVEDDIEEPPKESNNAESDTARPIMENSVQFTAETWLMSGGLDRTSAKFQCLSMMAISLTIALVIDT